MANEIINQKEIRFVGLQRCGNHAVINWILSQCSDKVFFLNFVQVNTNPYLTAVQDRLPGFSCNFDLERERHLLSQKDCLLYNYEDDDLRDVFSREFEEKHDCYVGKSRKRYDVLVLRDAFNFFACRLKWRKGVYTGKIPLTNMENANKLVMLWKMYANEFLGITQYLQHNKVVINYNNWFMDKDYRRHIAKLLSLQFTDKGLDCCAAPSTFENIEEGSKRARALQILDRWKYLADDVFYQKLLGDKKLVELSDVIFGKICNLKFY